MKKYVAMLLLVLMCFYTIVGVEAIRFSDAIKTDDSLSPPTIPNAWYADAYKFVIDELFLAETTTYNNDTYITNYDFIGDRLVNRSDVTVVLHRYFCLAATFFYNDYKNSTAGDYYLDVPDGQYYTVTIAWAAKKGITNGVGGAYFAPQRTVTREEFVTMLYRFTTCYLWTVGDMSARAPLGMFADESDVSTWAEDAMSWAVAKGLISGKPGNLIAPHDNITKFELATIIFRFNNNVVAHSSVPQFLHSPD